MKKYSSRIDLNSLEANHNLVAKKYWQARMEGFEWHDYFGRKNVADLTIHKPTSYCLTASDNTHKRLLDIAPSSRAIQILLLAATAVFAQKIASVDDVCIFTVGKGCFFPVRIKNFSEIDFRSLVEQVKTDLLSDEVNSDYPTEYIFRNKPEGKVGVLVNGMEIGMPTLPKTDLLFYINVSGGFQLTIEYNAVLYDKQYIGNLASYYLNLLEQLITYPEKIVNEIALIGEESTKQILHIFNNTEKSFPRDRTIMSMFAEQAFLNPNNLAVKYDKQCLSYGEIHRTSNRVANLLIAGGSKPGTVIGVCMDRSIALITVVFGILKAGCIYLPLSGNFPTERNRFILKNSKSVSVFADVKYLSNLPNEVEYLDISAAKNFSADDTDLSNPDGLAYIIYTSGTTGQPKGVPIRHRSLVNRIQWMQRNYTLTGKDILIQKTPLVFDVSVWELFWWCICGASVVMAPQEMEKDPVKLSQLVLEEKVTVIHFVPSMLNVLLHALDGMSTSGMLKTIKHLFSSGEELKPADALRFLKSYPNSKLHNLYGPTEATIDVSFYEVNPNVVYDKIPIGKPIDNTTLLIFNSRMQLQPIGIPGELYIGGENLTPGYIGNEELNSEKFVLNPFKRDSLLYKTGDITCWLPDGNIDYLGRVDNQVKIRGNRVELAEIESTLMLHPAVKAAVVLTRHVPDQVQLTAYVTTFRDLEDHELFKYLSNHLPDYMVPASIIPIDDIPLSLNGKLDRKKLLLLEPKASRAYVVPESDLEKTLQLIWEHSLGKEIEQVGVTDNFFRIGGDSLLAVRLIAIINNKLSTKLSVLNLFEHGTIRKLADYITTLPSAQVSTEYEDAAAEVSYFGQNYLDLHKEVDIESVYPMSDIEKGICFIQLSNPDSYLYFEQNATPVFYQNFDFEILKHALQLLAHQNPILRTAYDLANYAHIVYRNPEHSVALIDLSEFPRNHQRERIREDMLQARKKHFDLSKAPLWGLRMYRLGTNYHYMVFESHHAILDGWSFASFMTSLNNTYINLLHNLSFIPERPAATYQDYITEEWVHKRNKSNHRFWKEYLKGCNRLDFGVKNSCSDYKSVRTTYSAELVKQLSKVAESRNTSMKNLFFTAYLCALKVHTYENDIVTGLVSFNRPTKIDGDKLLGCFLNTIPFRIIFSENFTLSSFQDQVDDLMREVRKHEGLSLFDIHQEVDGRYQGGSPLFNTMFNFINFHVFKELKTEERADKVEDEIHFDNFLRDETMFGVSIHANEKGAQAKFDYVTSFMDDSLFRSFQFYFERVLELIAGGYTTVTDIMVPREKQRLVYELNKTVVNYDDESSIVSMFENQVYAHPERIAVKYDNQALSYGELNGKANDLAIILKKRLRPETKYVPILMNKCLEFPVAILAVLKLGLAYAPFDVNWPVNRVKQIMTENEYDLLLVNEYGNIIVKDEVFFSRTILKVDQGELNGNSPDPRIKIHSNLPFFVVYTSGTTGKPKGSVNHHAGILNRLRYMSKRYHIAENDVILMTSSNAFDAAVWQIIWPLINGVHTIIPKQERLPDLHELIKLIGKEKVTITDFVPAVFNVIADIIDTDSNSRQHLQTLRQLLIGGEVMSARHIYKFKAHFPQVSITNTYGPSETSIGTVFYEVSPFYTKDIPIGRPIDNVVCLILDKNKQLVAHGAVGELYLGGICVGYGYIGDPERTKTSFVKLDFENEFSSIYYKTGDLVKYMHDDNLLYVGRVDNQLKINGIRIEPGEIEGRMLQHQLISQASVIAKLSESGKRLVAYYVSTDEIPLDELKQFLAKTLPEYMVPSSYVHLNQMPLTAVGKLDTGALSELVMQESSELVAPSNAIQEQLISLWAEVLNLSTETIGINTNFFELGGHSISIMKLNKLLNETFGSTVSLTDMFRIPTIISMEQFIKAAALEKGVHKDNMNEVYNDVTAVLRIINKK